MSYSNILSSIICDTLEKNVPRGSGKALAITFRASIDWDREEGYRYFDLILYRKTNYTRVCYRTRWNTISIDDMEYDADEDGLLPKPGKTFQKGQSEWILMADHDSCWRYDGVERFLREHERSITTIDNINGNWYEVITPAFELPRYGQ